MVLLYIVVVTVGYFLGSIPFGYLLVKTFRGQDIRMTGSGNIGATNVARSGARGLGVLTLVFDALKGSAAMLFSWWLAHRNLWSNVAATRLMAVTALAAVLGHIFPVWLRFKGGKGVATALGVFAILFPKALVVSLVIFSLVVALTRYVSLGSMLAAVAFPVSAYFLKSTDWLTLLPVCATGILVIAKHHQNIRRLMAGNENRFGGRKPVASEREA
jgi:acyl phosphate:glycerol-3-phosphate acyltransferase